MAVARGWNTDYCNLCWLFRCLVLLSVFVGVERAGAAGVGCGCAVGCLRERACPVWGWFVVSAWAGRCPYRFDPCVGLGLAVPGLVVGLLFEICIVDASIFFLGFFVCKFSRAHGGCLGTRSR